MMNSIVERLLWLQPMMLTGRDIVGDAAKLIESQAERIKELEDEVEANLQERVRMQHTINQYESGDKVSRHYACPDCATLRQRIDDAPVVAIAGGDSTDSCSWLTFVPDGTKLISKEDLQKWASTR